MALRPLGASPPSRIETARLVLLALDVATLDAIAMQGSTPWSNPGGLLVEGERRLASIYADRQRDHPDEEGWVMRAMLTPKEATLLGHLGGHHAPDSTGRYEVGYIVATSFRRQGFAREGLLALLAAGARTGRIATVVASISPTNEPSLALVRQLGFRKSGEQEDPDDGLEWVHEAPIATVLAHGRNGGWLDSAASSGR